MQPNLVKGRFLRQDSDHDKPGMRQMENETWTAGAFLDISET
jgi:hypothetical protein